MSSVNLSQAAYFIAVVQKQAQPTNQDRLRFIWRHTEVKFLPPFF